MKMFRMLFTRIVLHSLYWLVVLAVAGRPAVGFGRRPAVMRERPTAGIELSDEEIEHALSDFRSDDIDAQVQALERIVSYFGHYDPPWRPVAYTYTHKATRVARRMLEQSQPVQFLVELLEHDSATAKAWGLCRLRKQRIRTDMKESCIRKMLEANTLVFRRIFRKNSSVIASLLAHSDEQVRAEALEIILTSRHGFPDPRGYLKTAWGDPDPAVRSRIWDALPKLDVNLKLTWGQYLKQDLGSTNDELFRSALSYLSAVDNEVRGSRITNPKRRVYESIRQSCVPTALNALRDRPDFKAELRTRMPHGFGSIHIRIQEPIMVRSQLILHPPSWTIFTASFDTQVRDRMLVDLHAFETIIGELTEENSSREQLLSALHLFREKLAVDDKRIGTSNYYYVPTFLDPESSVFTEIYPKILKRHTVSDHVTTWNARLTSFHVYAAHEDGYRWRILMAILDTPGWEDAFLRWDGSDLLRGLALQGSGSGPPP